MALTEAQKVAFSEWMEDILKENREDIEQAALNNKGVAFDTTGYITSLVAKETDYAGEEGKVTKLQAALQAQNKVANEKLDEYYKFASDAVEAVIGAIGKEHKLSGLLRNKRDSMANEAARGPEPSTP